LCGVGDFVLCGAFVKHRRTMDAWRVMSAKQRSKAVTACFKLSQASVTASDGGITVPTTPGADSGRLGQTLSSLATRAIQYLVC